MTKLKLWFALCAMLLASAAFARQSTTKFHIVDGNLTSTKKFEIYLESTDVTFPNTSNPNEAHGTGTITINYGSKTTTMPWDFTQQPIFVSASHQQVVGATYKLTSAVTEKSVGGSGVALEIPKDSIFTVVVQNNSVKTEFVPPTTPAGSSIKVAFPLKLVGGSATDKLTATVQSLKIGGDSNFDVQGTIALTSASQKTLTLGPACIYEANMQYHWYRQAGSDAAFELTVTNAKVGVAIQGATNPVVLNVQNASVNYDGQLTFTNASYTAGAGVGPQIEFLDPQGYVFWPKQANASMVKSVLTSMTMSGDLDLPDKFSASPTGNTKATLKNVSITYAPVDPANPSLGNDFVATVGQITQPVTFYWGGFSATLAATTGPSTGAPAVVIDLSSLKNPPNFKDLNGKPLPTNWKGVYFKSLTIGFPDVLKKSGGTPTATIENGYIDGEGFSGKCILENDAGIPGLRVPYGSLDKSKVTQLNATFYQSQLANFGAEGTLELDELDAELNVAFTISSTGATSISVDTSEPLDVGGSQDVRIKFERGSVWFNAQGKARLSLSGMLMVSENPSSGALQAVKGATLSIDGLAFDQDLHVSVEGVVLDLPHPYRRSIGPVFISISQIGFATHPRPGGNPNGPRYVEFLFTGDVGVEGLPVSGGIGFEGLKVSRYGSSFGGISADFSIENVGRLAMSLKVGSAQLKNAQGQVKETLTTYEGNGQFYLEAMGGAGVGGGLFFQCWKGGWYGEVNLSFATPIQLGTTPLYLRSGKAGLGHNVQSSTGQFVGIPGPNGDYKLGPRNPYDGNDTSDWKPWLFTAGIRVATLEDDLFWADLVLTAAWGNGFVIDITAKGVFGEKYDPMPNAMTKPHDKFVTATINYDSVLGRLLISSTGEFYFPSRKSFEDKKVGSQVKGSVKLVIDKTHLSLNIGDDVNLNTSPPTFTNPIIAYSKFGGSVYTKAEAAFILNGTFANNKISTIALKTGIKLETSVHLEGAWKKWKVVSDGNVGAYVGMAGKLSRATPQDSLSLEYLYGTLGISLNLSFKVLREDKEKFKTSIGIDAAVEAWYTRQADAWGGTYAAKISIKLAGINVPISVAGEWGSGASTKPVM